MGKGKSKLSSEPDKKVEFTKEMIEELYRCQHDLMYFANRYCYVVHPTEGKIKVKLREFQERIIRGIDDNRQSIILAPRQCGKALSLDTPILTPKGFVVLKELKVGDEIYGPDGMKTRIKFITETMFNHDVYNIEFNNGEIIKSDSEHLWTVDNTDWSMAKTIKTIDLISIQNRLQSRSKPSSLFIKNNNPIQFDKSQMLVHPYVLGVWLGDGNKNDGRITCHIDDYPHYKNQIEKFGYSVSQFIPDKRRETTGRFTIYGLSSQLKQLGILKNKSIPNNYIYTDIDSRVWLMRGLMDTDGYARKGGSCVFYQSHLPIIESVKFILNTLGIKNSVSEKKTIYKTCYCISFASNNFIIFSLARKVNIQKRCKKHPKNDRIYIRSIKKCESVPVRCLQVENEDHLFLCGKSLIPTHNTTAVSLKILHYAMFHEYKCCAILANKDETAKSILGDVKEAYESLPDWMKLGVTEYNAHTISFENGSKIFASATSKDAIAGESVSFLYIDECALIPENLAVDFYKANYPTVQKGEKIVITSTARGVGNLFHRTWKDAIDKVNSYVPIRVDYWEVPEYSSPEWKEATVADIGLIAFNSEFGNQFLGSQATVISADALKKLKSTDPVSEKDVLGGTEKHYETYDPKFSYLASIDISLGSGNDFDILNIFKIVWRSPTLEDYKKYEKKNEDVPEAIIEKIKQVFLFRSNMVNIPTFVDYVFEILPTWENPYLILENNGLGQSFADKMTEEYYYENTYYHEDSTIPGINSSSLTKNKMVNALKQYTEEGKLEVVDLDTINELLTFVEKKTIAGNSRFMADAEGHDDITVSCGWACFLAESLWMQDCLTFNV